MKANKLFFIGLLFVLALFLQACSSSSNQNASEEVQVTEQEAVSAADSLSVEMDKVIQEVETKTQETEDEVDKLLEGI